MPSIEVTDLVKEFGPTRAVGPVSFSIRAGEFVSLLGPSGCGKTTTLRMIAGFEPITSGSIRIAEREMAGVPIERRGVGMVFQNYALFPHLDVFENVAFGLRLQKRTHDDVAARVGVALSMVGMDGYARRMPRQLSGGQQQRVALARALAVEPSVLLLDEPLSNLDLKLREQMRDEIRSLQRRLGITALYVTHDQGEAMSMSDRIVVMNRGAIEQIGASRDVYERPESIFVARFIGQCTVLDGAVRYDGASGRRFVTRSGVSVALPPDLALRAADGHCALVIRPEAVRIGESGASGGGPLSTILAATVNDVVYAGEKVDLSLRLERGDAITVAMRVAPGQPLPRSGDAVSLTLDARDMCIVPADEAVTG